MVYGINKETIDKIVQWKKDLVVKDTDKEYKFTDGDMVDMAICIFDSIIEQTIGKE